MSSPKSSPKSETTPAQRNRPIQDLREWLDRVE